MTSISTVTYSIPAGLTIDLFSANDDTRPIYITGSFNQWRVREEQFRMEKIGEGRYRFVFPVSLLVKGGPIEYKYVKGGWEAEELNENGMPAGNRIFNPYRPAITDYVPRWKKHSEGYNPVYYPDIQIISKRFHLPQLRRKRRISILLPWDYHQTNKHYPVLYLQDGQNLFEEDAPFGTWGVDKRLAALAGRGKGDLIVVAIDHGGKERIREFNPYTTRRWGEGLGEEYARFLAETLKPYIDRHFRTRPEREHTGIGGSSMGGLISIYAGIVCPQVFSKFMIFSPSLWVSPKIYFEPLQFTQFPSTRVYLYAGEAEGAGMVENARRFKQLAEEKAGYGSSNLHFHLSIDPAGQHNEERWGREFPYAAEWLFF